MARVRAAPYRDDAADSVALSPSMWHVALTMCHVPLQQRAHAACSAFDKSLPVPIVLPWTHVPLPICHVGTRFPLVSRVPPRATCPCSAVPQPDGAEFCWFVRKDDSGECQTPEDFCMDGLCQLSIFSSNNK